MPYHTIPYHAIHRYVRTYIHAIMGMSVCPKIPRASRDVYLQKGTPSGPMFFHICRHSCKIDCTLDVSYFIRDYDWFMISKCNMNNTVAVSAAEARSCCRFMRIMKLGSLNRCDEAPKLRGYVDLQPVSIRLRNMSSAPNLVAPLCQLRLGQLGSLHFI